MYVDDLWVVHHVVPPYGLAGWMVLKTRRHVPGIAYFDDAETTHFGPLLRHLQRVLEEITGAQRIYTAALGESVPHFHCHMVPRYQRMPEGAIAFDAFLLGRLAAEGKVAIDSQKVLRITDAYRARLATDPPPPPPRPGVGSLG